MKVYLDNNFFTKYEACNDETYKQKIRDAFINRSFSFYPSIELLDEMLGVAASGISPQLVQRFKLFLEICSGRVFNYHGRIIQDELGVSKHSVFLPSSEASIIDRIIQNVLNGTAEQNQINEFLNEIKKRKEDHLEYYKQQQADIKKEGAKLYRASFDEFKSKIIKRQLIEFINYTLKVLGKNETESVVEGIVDNVTHYKYFNVFLSAIAGLHYNYFVKNYRVEGSDYYDVLHLFYLTDLDAIFTNDAKMGCLCELIFKNNKKLISFESIKEYL